MEAKSKQQVDAKKVSLQEVYKSLYEQQEAKRAKDSKAKALNLSENVEVEITQDLKYLKKGTVLKVSFVVAEYYKANGWAK